MLISETAIGVWTRNSFRRLVGPGLGSEDGGGGGSGGGEQSQTVGEAKEREGIVTTQGNPVKYSFFFQEKEAKR